MVDFIVYLLLFALVLLCFYYERKEKKRKEHENWIYDCRQCLVRITNSFRRDCQAIAEEAFARYTNIILHDSYRHTNDYMSYLFLSDYRNTIDAIKEDYIENVTAKVKEAQQCYTFTSIPDFLFDEYCTLILYTYNTFRDFEHLMWKHINDEKGKLTN